MAKKQKYINKILIYIHLLIKPLTNLGGRCNLIEHTEIQSGKDRFPTLLSDSKPMFAYFKLELILSYLTSPIF